MRQFGWKVHISRACYCNGRFTHNIFHYVIINANTKKELPKTLYPELKTFPDFDVAGLTYTSSPEFIYRIEFLGSAHRKTFWDYEKEDSQPDWRIKIDMYEQDEQTRPPKITCFQIGFIILACLFIAGIVVLVMIGAVL